MLSEYRKFIAAVVGAGVTSALQIWGPDTKVGQILTVVSAVLTAVAVYTVPNETEPGGSR